MSKPGWGWGGCDTWMGWVQTVQTDRPTARPFLYLVGEGRERDHDVAVEVLVEENRELRDPQLAPGEEGLWCCFFQC